MSRISRDLNKVANLVEASLHGYLDIRRTWVPERLSSSMQYSAYAGGKRIRPFLTVAFCQLFGGRDTDAIPFACALECVHTYSLIHDDLPCMDDDDIRRGKPTNHKIYGESTALLAGDALLTYAFQLMTEKSAVPARETLAAVQYLAYCAGMEGMVGGQQLDLEGETVQHDFETLERMHRQKTGALMQAAAYLGCCAAGVSGDAEKCRAAITYAENIGLAFQVVDDILDQTGDMTILGKPIGSDILHQKTTFLTFMSPAEARAYAEKCTQKACDAIAEYEGSERLTELANYLLNRNK